MTDHSQHKEQERILEFFGGKKSGFFIDIGAGDGLINSNTHALWELGWAGILIEASIPTFLVLAKNYEGAKNVTLLNVAIGQSPGLRDFYHHPTEPGWSSMNEKWVERWRDKAELRQVLVVPLSSLGLAPHPDLLSIDTEGNDAEILENLPAEFQPKLIVAEIDKQGAEQRIMQAMNKRGYHEIWRTCGNAAFALKQS